MKIKQAEPIGTTVVFTYGNHSYPPGLTRSEE